MLLLNGKNLQKAIQLFVHWEEILEIEFFSF